MCEHDEITEMARTIANEVRREEEFSREMEIIKNNVFRTYCPYSGDFQDGREPLDLMLEAYKKRFPTYRITDKLISRLNLDIAEFMGY